MSFDRVAAVYDATRALPESVVTRVADRVVAATQAGAETRFLEVGIGTGRIALPLIQQGYSYTGVDISTQMMDHLRAKVAGSPNRLTLVEADVTDLPFPNQSFDVVLTVHVLHLVPEWRAALQEARRVLQPRGYLVEGHDQTVAGDPGDVIRKQWAAFVREAGAQLRPRYEGSEIEAELTAQGGMAAVYRAASWQTDLRPIDLINAQRQRTFSQSWDVPEDVLTTVHQRMLRWAREHYGNIDEPVPTRGEFLVSVTGFSSLEPGVR